MHSKRPDVVTEHSKQSSERTYATSARALWEKPRKQEQQPVQQCSSHTLSPSDPTAQEMDESSIPAALVSESSGVLMLLLPGCPVRARTLRHCPCPCAAQQRPGSPVQGQPGHCTGASVLRGTETALKQPPALLCSRCTSPSSPAVPLYSPERVCTGLWVPLCSGRFPGKQRCAVTAGLSHSESCSYCPGKELGCCSRARGMKPPARRERAQHPRDNIEPTRWSTRRSRGCLN